MDRRVFVLFCLLTAVRSGDSVIPKISNDDKVLKCEGGNFADDQIEIKLIYENSGLHTCKSEDCTDESCPKVKILVKILSSENLIELDSMVSLVSVIVSDILVTILIGWAVYSICAQSPTRSSYQGNKASDKQSLINNHTPSGGDTYQRLNTRSDEYSSLHAPRKNKNKQSV